MKHKTKSILVGGGILFGLVFLAFRDSEEAHAQARTNQTNEAQGTTQNVPKTREELQLEIEEVKRKIQELKENQEREQTYHKEFVTEKLSLIRDFESENINLNSEILDTKNEILIISNDINEIELFLERESQRNELYMSRLLEYVLGLKTSVLTGFPFDVKKRAATIQAIIDDLKANRSTVIESFYRLLKFLNDEEALAYDSQIIQSVETINDEPVNATVLRIGRFYLAVQVNDEAYLYRKGPNNDYFIDSENPLGLFDKRNVETAILMIQGRKPPDLLELPVPPNLIRKNYTGDNE